MPFGFCFRLVFGLFCAVRVVSVKMGFHVGFGCFWFGTLMGGRYGETASCAILQVVFSEWVVVVIIVIFSRVSEISDTFFCVCVCVFSWPHERVDPEECVMVFQHIFGPWHHHPQECFHFECGRGSLQGWTDVDSMVMLIFLCLAVDVVLHAAFQEVCSVLTPHS